MMDQPHGGEAKLRFHPGEYEVLRPGAYVHCAVSGAQVSLNQLKYWSVTRQEAYAGPAEATEAYERTMARGGRP